MYLFRIFYSFLPLRNPLGFGASDLVILAIALLFVLMLLMNAWLSPHLRRLSSRLFPCMAVLFLLVIATRLALWSQSPTPTPSGADDFSYLLLGDTVAHFRLANAAHPLSRFFESVFILQQPTYSSIYPLAQGFVLAAGQWLGNPWIGVLLCGASFSAVCYWMLRDWVSPPWALVGGLLSVIQFGALSPWMNSYWGGYVSAIAGCLVFGALPRLACGARIRDGILLGGGLALQILSRSFESVFLCVSAGVYLAFNFRGQLKPLLKPLAGTLTFVSVALLLTLAQNQAVTKNWSTLPYVLSRYQYGVPTTFTFQPNPVPHRSMTAEQEMDFQAQAAIHGNGPETTGTYAQRILYRFRYLRCFLLPPLLVALIAFLPNLKQPRFLWALGTAALFVAAANFYPYFYPHYVAAITCLIVMVCVKGLERLGPTERLFVLVACFTAFGFWFGVYASGDNDLFRLTEYQSWNYLNRGDTQGRVAIENQISAMSGQQLVFVRYAASHRFEEWVHNSADLDGSNVVWANDFGAEANEALLSYYPKRRVWMLEPDAWPPVLKPYEAKSDPFLSVH